MAKATAKRAKVVDDGDDDRGKLPVAPAVIGKAVAYLRTSSATNVGDDKDTGPRQRGSITEFAARAGYELVGEFYDAAVSGARRKGDHELPEAALDRRPGFSAMLAYLAGNGAKTIIIESPDRFARDLAVQLAGHDLLKRLGYQLVPTTAPDFFTADTPTAELVRQVLGAIAQFEKAALVAKLAGARKRRREASPDGRCEGRKSLGELHPEAAALAKRLNKTRKDRKPQSLRGIAMKLAARGKKIGQSWHRKNGEPWHATSVKALIEYRPATTRAASTTSPMAK